MGKRNLESALRSAGPELDVTLEWKPYFLRTGIPEEGTPKPGGPGIHQVNARLLEVGKSVGIDFTGLCPRFPNTKKAHCLLAFALENGGNDVQNRLQEVLFRHYFTDGLYPDVENLVKAAGEVGLPEAEARQALVDRRYEQRVTQEAQEASQGGGVSGVPYFFFNGKPAFSGAQPPEMILNAMRNA